MLTGRSLTAAPALRAGGSIPDLPSGIQGLAAFGVALIVAIIVGSTPIGSGDYGQWLMVAHAFSGGETPAYRSVGDVPPLIPVAIGWLQAWLGDPVAALRAIGAVIVLALGAAFHAAGTALGGRSVTGLIAVVLALLVTDRYLDLLAFGGLLQAGAIAFMVLSVAAFLQAARSPRDERRWWFVGCVTLFATALTHVPTATIALPVCLATAAFAARPGAARDRDADLDGRPASALRIRLRETVPLFAALGVIGVYWLFVAAPESIDYVSNPASLAYRGPERVPGLLAAYPPTLAVVVIGFLAQGRWAARLIAARALPARTDARAIVAIWLAASWGAYGVSALSGASTDYPRFVPLLVAPLVVAAADGFTTAAAWFARRFPRRADPERGLVTIGLAIVLVAPFSIANYRSEAQGYQLPDAAALAAAAAWTDLRLKPGLAVLAPVREAKWVEGLTGRSALFSSDVRYAFRPIEWERSLAAEALLRGDLAVANESFVLTLTDGAPAPAGSQPRAILVAPNHGGEYLDLLRLVPASSVILGGDGDTLATLPALEPSGFERVVTADSIAVTTRWTGTRQGSPLAYIQTLTLARGSDSFDIALRAESELAVSGLQLELRPPVGVAIVRVDQAGSTADLAFGRTGRTEPRLRLTVTDGTIAWAADGRIVVAAPGPRLSLRVTDLSAGGASTSLGLLDPAALIDAYDVGAAILRRDPTYDARRARLEALGFHVARAEGPYIVMVRAGAARPAAPSPAASPAAP